MATNKQFVGADNLKADAGPGLRIKRVAGATVASRVAVKLVDGKIRKAGLGDVVYGIGQELKDVLVNKNIIVATGGTCDGIAGNLDVDAYQSLKIDDNGKLIPMLTSAEAGDTVKASVGSGFGNQPANDGIEIVSDSTSDTQTLRCYGTTNGGETVVVEDVVLTGTTAVPSVKTDWGVMLGFEIVSGPAAVGTITVREASGNATITTLTAGLKSKGVVVVQTPSQRVYHRKPEAVASGASTKVIGVVGLSNVGAASYKAVALTGTTHVEFPSAMSKVTKLLVGDVAGATTVTVKVNRLADSHELYVGEALSAAKAGAELALEFKPSVRHDPTEMPEIGIQTKRFTYNFAGDGGATGTLILGDTVEKVVLPADACIVSAHLEMVTAFTSGGSATVALGVTGNADLFMAATAFDDATLALDSFIAVDNELPSKITAERDVIMTIADAALTAGRFTLTVQYLQGS